MAESTGLFRRHPLDAIFSPRNVAVIGASETPGSVGRTLLWNLISHPFGGAVFPVNPKRASVLGIHAYPSILDVPAQVDLAVIITPAHTVPGIIDDCVKAGVKGAIIISAGFKEIGERGAELERMVLERARSAQMRIIGPNCLGVMSPLTGLNATFAKGMALPGNVGFISQSGALCTAVLDWSFREHVGFSAFVSVGSMLDVNWGDLIYYLGDDERTRSIVMYMESIGDAEAFMSAAREVALTKPIIVIKAGRSAAAAKAAASHTGSLAGSDDVLDAAFRRCGVLRVEYISHLFAMAEVLAKQPRPAGPRLTILTNAGGPGVLATDMLMAGKGKLAELSDETMAAFNEVLPQHWSHNNPVDIIGDADPARYTKAVKIAIEDQNTDGLMVILTPQDMTFPTQTAEHDGRGAQRHAQAGPRQLDGRPRCGGRRRCPQSRQHSHLRLPGHRRQHLQLHVALCLQPALDLRDALTARCRRLRSDRSEARHRTDRGRAHQGPHDPHRVRVEADLRRLWHLDRAHAAGE